MCLNVTRLFCKNLERYAAFCEAKAMRTERDWKNWEEILVKGLK